MNENQKREEFTHYWLDAEPSVSAYVFASISGFHDAEDMVQRIAQELARRFDEYDSSRPFVGWALWIAKSRVIDFYRTQDRKRVVFSDALSAELAGKVDGEGYLRFNLEGDDFDAALNEAGLPTAPSHTNFALIRFGSAEEAQSADAALRSEGVVMRPMGGYGLPQCLRVTVGLQEDMDFALSLLKAWKASR